MKIILLGEKSDRFASFLYGKGYPITAVVSEPLDAEQIPKDAWLISYGYRHIIKRDVLERLERPPINLHISLLPWNRGADPNLWSWIDGTPKGVTIHNVDAGLDTGPILLQKRLFFTPWGKHTLESSYNRLCSEIEKLFRDNFDRLLHMRIRPRPQGSSHRTADKANIVLPLGWKTPVRELAKMRTQPKAVKIKGDNHEATHETVRPVSVPS